MDFNEYLKVLNTYNVQQLTAEAVKVYKGLMPVFDKYKDLFKGGMLLSVLIITFVADKKVDSNELSVITNILHNVGIYKVSKETLYGLINEIDRMTTRHRIIKVAKELSPSDRIELAKFIAINSRMGDGIITDREMDFINKILSAK